MRRSRGNGCRVAVVSLNDLHFVKGEGKHPLLADPEEFFVRDFQVYLPDLDLSSSQNFGDMGREAALGGKLGVRKDGVALDKGVAEQARCDFFNFTVRERSGKEVLDRVIDVLFRPESAAGEILDRFTGGPAGVIGDAGPEADFNGIVKPCSQGGIHAPVLNDRVAERPCRRIGKLPGRELCSNGIDVDASDASNLQLQQLLYLFPDPFAAGIAQAVFECDFNSVCHLSVPYECIRCWSDRG